MNDTTNPATPTRRFREMIAVLRQRDVFHGITPLKLRQILEDLGPTFVKLGQFMSMRPDFLPQEYCDELMTLQTRANPMPFAVVRGIIERESRCRLPQLFASVDEQSLGSASIAQVHRAVLKGGERVVVKVQRPGIYDVMAQDVILLKRVAALWRVLSHATGDDVIDFAMLLDEMWLMAKQEMDFLMEAQHIDEFRHYNADDPHVDCPRVNHRLTTSRMLVMEYVDGIRLDDPDALKAKGFDLDQLGARLCENYVKQMLVDGYFHADPHPGNLWIREGKIVWLDLGMMGRLSPRDRNAVRRALAALAAHDTFEMKAAMLDLGLVKGKLDHARLYEDIDALLSQYGDLDFSRLQMGVLTRQIMAVLKKYRIGIGAGLSAFARGVLTIEGVMRRCCPNVSFVAIFARGLQLDAQQDWQLEWNALKRNGYVLVKKTMQLPEQISDFLRMMLGGQAKVNLEITGSEEPLERVNHMVNKLIVGIIGAAVLLGLSLGLYGIYNANTNSASQERVWVFGHDAAATNVNGGARVMRGIRGAITVGRNEADEIRRSARELVSEMCRVNHVAPGDIGVCLFSATEDLTAAFPASGARQLPGFDMVPLFDTRQMAVEGALPMCIRVLMLVDGGFAVPGGVHHVYLGGASVLRQDLRR